MDLLRRLRSIMYSCFMSLFLSSLSSLAADLARVTTAGLCLTGDARTTRSWQSCSVVLSNWSELWSASSLSSSIYAKPFGGPLALMCFTSPNFEEMISGRWDERRSYRWKDLSEDFICECLRKTVHENSKANGLWRNLHFLLIGWLVKSWRRREK